MAKKIFCLFFTLLLSLCAFCMPAAAYTPTDFEVQSEYAYVASLDTGAVLFEKNADERAYPAALTNIMTAVILCENVSDLQGTVITVPEEAYTMLLGTGAAITGLKPGEQLTANDLLHAIILSSAPDSAIAIAYHVAGGIPAFLQMMNEKATELGMDNTNFNNVTGLEDANHYTTAADMYKLGAYAANIAAIKEAAKLKRYTIPKTNKSAERTLSTTNYLVDIATNYYYMYATGMKTGFTDEAGRCLVATASYEGYSYICVLMKAPNRIGNRAEFIDAANIFKWAFTDFEYKTVVAKDELIGEIGIELAWDVDHIPLYPQEDVSALIPKTADSSTITIEYDFDINKSIEAPVKKGQVIGKGRIFYAGQELGEVNIVSGETVKKNAYLGFARTLRNIISSTLFRILLLIVGGIILAFILFVLFINRKKRRRRGVHKW